MTAQAPDTYLYNGQEYNIVAMTSPIDFNPEEFGFRPVAPTTACWRGYICEYTVTDEELYLSKLRIFCDNNPYPVFEDVSPVKDKVKYSPFMVYDHLHHNIDYTGSIVVGSRFLEQYYIHMGFQRAWAYENVYELKLEHGKVIRMIDHSKVVEEIRMKINEDPDFDDRLHNDICRFVEESFSLDKDVKAWWI